MIRGSAPSTPRTLALIGDRWHSPTYIRGCLSSALESTKIELTFTEDVAMLSAASLQEYELLVILRDDINWPRGCSEPPLRWMTEAQQEAISDFVTKSGRGFLALHNAVGNFPANGAYRKLLGGETLGHLPPYSFTVRVEDRSHEITKGIEDFEVFDEQHIINYDHGDENVLLRSAAKDGLTTVAGWYGELGKGRVCYLAPGHTPEALGHPMMQSLVRNACSWLLDASSRGVA